MQLLTAHDIRDPARLRDCIRRGASVMKGASGSVPLKIAVSEALVESCRILLEAGADPHCGGWDANESLLYVVIENRYPALHQIIGTAEPAFADETMHALLALLIEHGLDPNGVVPETGHIPSCVFPLYRAAELGDLAAVRSLVELGANVDQLFDYAPGGMCLGQIKTVLQSAKDFKREGLMVELLKLGASDSRIKYGSLTGFQHCVELGYDKVVEYYLRERGEDLGQIARIVTSEQTLEELAVKESTKLLLRSFAVETAVASAAGGVDGHESASIARMKASQGMAL